MRGRPAVRTRAGAITLGGTTVLMELLSLWLIAAGAAQGGDAGTAGAVIWTVGIAGAPVVGLVIALRRPENRYGWLLLAFGFLTAANNAAGLYAGYASGHGGDVLPAALAESALWPAMPMFLPLLVLFFPDGKLPSRRWRWFAVAVAGCGAVAVVTGFWLPGELDVHPPLENPYAASGVWGDVVTAVASVAVVAMFAAVIPAALSMVGRWRRATGQERLQLRWFTAAAALLALVLVGTGAGAFIPSQVVNDLLFAATLTAMFVAIGIAVLRYRLYQIDRIISRTVTYAAVTLVVAAIYLGAVTAITRMTSNVAGDSPLAVAAATLLAAAAFGPARRRIQRSVDHRFNRARYDALRTTEAYRARLRDQFDLDNIGTDLAATASRTVQPSSVILWLRDSEVTS